ncbi:DUF3047 domain-containing protein [Ramlibacter tataouinensis]|uniref:DUF3047 domain-containing protein n=1 Tax=Ramlibacter tataouinensis (strain ATCC BAA-407 / DSM 14655 / LMG 21543 / TTB310) TaxID=365046 RepID=F5Y5W6_RAMTT|nr:DUF3047 domain-containing protein [Ramlibacter tataouinensis]AEG91470.1 Hypothetical protein Rta_03990 [Ramlibacter tataouinensis TTB310]
MSKRSHDADEPLRIARRDALLWGAAMAALPLDGAGAAEVALPRFSTAPPGGGPPPGWVHETLPKVRRANVYAVTLDDGVAVLHVRSRASASSLLATVPAGTRATRLRWRWKVSNALAGSDLRTRAGDDYAARLYVLFDLPPERLSLADRLRLQAARSLSGREIPAAAICYAWGTAQAAGSTGWNPYTDRVRMVVLESGDARVSQWRPAERDLRQDWEESFGGAMPPVRAIAVGADTDNTGDGVDAWFGDVLLSGA